jgi:hypothetical protein
LIVINVLFKVMEVKERRGRGLTIELRNKMVEKGM